ncbi:MAG: GatB/YqeY domain-containing protein [Chloroflexi bacterium]|nr:GatB/YqeY domain-containing protein [Chloroflexota bacterium]
MGLLDKLREDLKAALRKGEKVRVSALRLAISAAGYAEMAKGAPLADSDVLGVIAKEVKQRQESIEAFKQGHREDLVAQEQQELEILQAYLPRQLGREEIVAAARAAIAATGAKGPSDKGKVMPKLIAELKGQADGREINAVVTELLSAR